MTRARDIANLLDANGDIVAGALDNVPASNDASALTTGTLAGARLPDPLPAVDGSNLTGIVSFASGTLMLFQQTAAPTGWTKQTTHNDKALRVVTGSAGSGGSSAFTTALGTPSVGGSLSGSIGDTTLSTNQIPSHSHGVYMSNGYSNVNPKTSNTNNGGSLVQNNRANGAALNGTTSVGGGGSHNHNFSGNLSGSTATINVQYVDVIIAAKD